MIPPRPPLPKRPPLISDSGNMDGRSFAFYKETAFGLWGLYWLHQWGIPYRYCRFHCCLAAHQRTRKKDSAEPSFPILWTPPHPPGESAAAGKCRLPRVWGNVGSCIPVLSLLASSEYCAAFCVRAGIVRVSVGLLGYGRTFFIIGGVGRLFLRLRVVFAMVFCRICANRDWVVCLGGYRYGIPVFLQFQPHERIFQYSCTRHYW